MATQGTIPRSIKARARARAGVGARIGAEAEVGVVSWARAGAGRLGGDGDSLFEPGVKVTDTEAKVALQGVSGFGTGAVEYWKETALELGTRAVGV